MRRQILIELDSDEMESYYKAYEIIRQFQNRSCIITHVAFSANIGEFGAFITDYESTFNAWQVFKNKKQIGYKTL